MTTSHTETLTRRDLETRLIEKAWKDPDFREEVLRDPKGVFERYVGRKLSEQLKVYVHEEDVNTLHLSIPPAPSAIAELSDEGLEKVAGGTGATITIAVLTANASVAMTG